MSSILIRNGHIFDGTGSPWFNADILIDDEKISKISRDRANAKLTIDASLLVEFKGRSP